MRLSELPENHKFYRPLYLDKEFKQSERLITKYIAKVTWFGDREEDGREWRSHLKGDWAGAKPLQRKVKGMKFSSVMQVPT